MAFRQVPILGAVTRWNILLGVRLHLLLWEIDVCDDGDARLTAWRTPNVLNMMNMMSVVGVSRGDLYIPRPLG